MMMISPGLKRLEDDYERDNVIVHVNCSRKKNLSASVAVRQLRKRTLRDT